MTNKKQNSVEIIFDNGGGITLQIMRIKDECTYCRYYTYPDAAAEDARGALEGDDFTSWDGYDDQEDWQEYDAETDRNGGYDWRTQGDIVETIESGKYDPQVMGGAEQAFWAAMGCNEE